MGDHQGTVGLPVWPVVTAASRGLPLIGLKRASWALGVPERGGSLSHLEHRGISTLGPYPHCRDAHFAGETAPSARLEEIPVEELASACSFGGV